MLAKLRQKLPGSIVARMMAFTLLAILLAQIIISAVWYSRFKQQETKGLNSALINLAAKIAATADNFQTFPIEYRHVVLEQLRQMGGTRFFVSLNEDVINIEPLPLNQKKQQALLTVKKTLAERVKRTAVLKVDFSDPDTLRVFNNQVRLKDLPKSWAHHSLTFEHINPPVLVVQLQLENQQWLYIASVLPGPYLLLDDQILPKQQLLFIALIGFCLLMSVYFLVRWQLKPLKALANAAEKLSRDINTPLLKEEGANELLETTRAFNRMQERLKRYLNDRENLFRAISHDLKTPITRLRLRVELLEDQSDYKKFNHDLDELEMLVKGALQIVKETSIHENSERIDVQKAITQVLDDLASTGAKVNMLGNAKHQYRFKPLAFRRCIMNIAQNSIKYGHELTLEVVENEEHLQLFFRDKGPGIPSPRQESVFTPYVRLENDNDGHGLGLGIARDIVLAHGGNIRLKNLTPVGLEVCVEFPRQIEETNL